MLPRKGDLTDSPIRDRLESSSGRVPRPAVVGSGACFPPSAAIRSAGKRTVSPEEMPEPIVVVDTSEVSEGKLEELKTAFGELVEFVQTAEADPIAYGVYLSEDGARVTVVQIHPSSAAMEYHLEVAGPLFRRFSHLLELARVDFYGQPSEALVDLMRRKAKLLGNAPVVVNQQHAGFTRFAAGGESAQ